MSLAGMMVFLIVAVSCQGRHPVRDRQVGFRPVPVEAVQVKKRTVIIPIRESGQLSAKDQIKLGFLTGGIIEEVSVDEGRSVTKGQKLASLNLSEIQAKANEATLAWQKAVKDYKRVLNLYRDSVATLEQLEHARTQRDIALNNLHIARFNLDHSVIRAPADGNILKKLADAG
ncbi:MAG TPA: efflux RND transporter periplasmic adaptor subunit, partial [Bacteroidetes bacterium]|nr:efflux RND transporter periplasmic adaptor subunit [Bacteroidota bacterium]